MHSGFQELSESITLIQPLTAVLQLIMANQISAKCQELCTNFV